MSNEKKFGMQYCLYETFLYISISGEGIPAHRIVNYAAKLIESYIEKLFASVQYLHMSLKFKYYYYRFLYNYLCKAATVLNVGDLI